MAEEETEGDVRRLVERLECGQRKLKRAIGLMNKSTVKAPEDRRRLGNRTREGKRTASPGHSPQKSADRPILRNVDSLPRKRARLVNLALSPPSSPPHSCGTHRRLSSTPKNTIAPSPDISLEEALLGEKGHHVTPCSKRKDLNTSQTAQELCDGSRKKKGLSVSFQLMGNDKGERESGMNTPARSLNSSRYGALEQRQRTPVIPRKQSGKDIQLLGYDWIAGLMDAGPHTSQFSEQHLQELREFRHVNRAECYMPEEKSL